MIITVSRATCTMNEPDRQDIQGPGLDEHRAEKSPGWFRSVEKGVGRSFHVAERMISRIAQRRTLSVFLVGLLSFLWSATFSLLIRMPRPMVHDEFSYLLAADTFAHGRLTNPTHPLWVHFESMHIIHRPTYASKYPPGQGLALAAGQVLTGYPIVGAWLSTALACSALCWMLMAWMPPRWALIGGILAVVHPIIFEWGQTYWGGSVSMLGGALLLGAARRIVEKPKLIDGVRLGLGMVVLANSRPFEGLVLSGLVLLTLCAWTMGSLSLRWRGLLTKIIMPLLIVLMVGAGLMVFYNLRVTGSALRMPYSVHEATYGVVPLFLWQEARPLPKYRHNEIEKFHGMMLEDFVRTKSRMIPELSIRIITYDVLLMHLWLLCCFILLLTFPMLVGNKLMCAVVVGWVAFGLALLTVSWHHPHYFAPAFGLIFIWEVQGLRLLRICRWRGRRTGRLITRAFLVLCVAWLLPAGMSLSRLDQEIQLRSQISQRAAVLSHLASEAGYHLVVVRYGREHNPHAEWVYNDADIDRAKVVWAREMGTARDRELLNYFNDRKIWLLEADATPPTLTPYPK